MIGIYSFTSKKDGRRYIGQSTNIERRYEEHLKWPSKFSKFDQILKAVGIEQFDFEIIEECAANKLDERERYWIKYYDSKNNGLNLTMGGQSYRGDANPACKLSDEQVLEIINLLRTSTLSMKDIAAQYQVHYNTIDGINRCKHWTHLHNYSGNIREKALLQKEYPHKTCSGENSPTHKITEKQALDIIKKLESTTDSLPQISRNLGISINIVQDINRCKTWKYLHSYKRNVRKGL